MFTARLSALQNQDEKEAHGEVGRGNDFSFWCNCQDGEIKSVTVKGWAIENAPGRKVVEAKFLLDGKKQDLLFYFERTKAGWKIDDVQSRGADAWTLSVVYKYGSADGKLLFLPHTIIAAMAGLDPAIQRCRRAPAGWPPQGRP